MSNNQKNFAVLNALKNLKATSKGRAVTIKVLAAEAGVSCQVARHYVYARYDDSKLNDKNELGLIVRIENGREVYATYLKPAGLKLVK